MAKKLISLSADYIYEMAYKMVIVGGFLQYGKMRIIMAVPNDITEVKEIERSVARK